MDPAWALAQPRLSASLGEGSFLLGFKQLNNETETETDAAQALFGDQRMKKWELSSQINFSPTWWEGFNFRVKTKGGEEWG